MGGYGSGRRSLQHSLEDGLKLSISTLVRDGIVRPYVSQTGTLAWTFSGDAKPFSTIGYQVIMLETSGRLRLQYTTSSRLFDGKRSSDYWIDLVATPQPFGGVRWWFQCPRTHARVMKLYLPIGATQFASRKAFRVLYKSQLQSDHDRALDQAFRRRRRLGDNGALGDYVFKPKWMRVATFERQMAKIERLESIVTERDAYFARHSV